MKKAFGKFQFLEGVSSFAMLTEITSLKVHGLAVIGKIDQIISHLSDTKAVTESCLELDRLHLSENIKPEAISQIIYGAVGLRRGAPLHNSRPLVFTKLKPKLFVTDPFIGFGMLQWLLNTDSGGTHPSRIPC